MAKDKKMVEAITSMEEDFAQWYTDVVKKADLIDEQTGAILLNRGNNRFLYAPQEGMLYPRDLNRTGSKEKNYR